jgi:RimJ/RimL family protein N-acetyltransferase
MKAPQRLETGRLVLSAPAIADAREIFDRYASDPEVTRYLGWPQHRAVEDTEAFVRASEREWQERPAGAYMIRAREDARLLGGTGLAFDAGNTTEAVTGYVLARDAWGRGYATEALTAMVALAERIDVACLYAFCHPDHHASAHVLEKCGFTRDPTWTMTGEFPNLAPGVRQKTLRYHLRLHASRTSV